MRRLIIAVCVGLLAIVTVAVIILRMTFSSDAAYPPAPALRPAVAMTVEGLLAEYENFLASKAPAVLDAMQPGLSDSEIDALEQKHSLKLTHDLRALYRWRNGTLPGATLDAFPNHRFVPIDLALADRDNLRKQVASSTFAQRQAYAMFAGHREPWVGVIVDLAGDGHFFDPARSESQGSFFYSFTEDGNYVFYPAFRNYLAAVVDGEKSGVFVVGLRGVETSDFFKAEALWLRFGARPQR